MQLLCLLRRVMRMSHRQSIRCIVRAYLKRANFAICISGQGNKKAPQDPCGACIITGAASRTRTGDPILTMDVLYLLS